MKRQVLNCGYVPLVDCAPLIIAKEMGFADAEGITLNLLRQPSWSALRDLLALGHLDVAHMLSPMPVAMSSGLSGSQIEIDAPYVLSSNGTVVGVSNSLAASIAVESEEMAPPEFVLALERADIASIRVGVPFPYSMHRLVFEHLLQNENPELLAKCEFITTPPPRMADAVGAGDIDVFCVGEPWGTVAVNQGAGELILPSSSIILNSPEKVLGMRRPWRVENTVVCHGLLRAIYRASEWLGQAENLPLASEILARSEHLDLSDWAIDPALTGRLTPRLGASAWRLTNFMQFFADGSTVPHKRFGSWIGAQIATRQGLDTAELERVGADCFRPDVYDHALGGRPNGISRNQDATSESPSKVAEWAQVIL